MKTRLALTCLICVCIMLSTSAIVLVNAQGYVHYKIQIASDCSAMWTITQVQESNATIETWQGFQDKLLNLINSASAETGRNMSLDSNSLFMQTTFFSETASKKTEYQFTWLNFSTLNGDEITFGDSFQVPNFFGQLYGDGELQITYPANYTVNSVVPQPNGDQTNPQILDWLGTQFFVNGNPSITLAPATTSTPSPQADANGLTWQMYVVVAVVAVAALFAAGIYLFRRRTNSVTPPVEVPTMRLIVESDEQKILNLLRNNGGSQYQSAITEAAGFSKAKTSQLLSALEKRGIVTRYKKGRDKIVTLSKQAKREKP